MALKPLSLSPSRPTVTLKSDHRRSPDYGSSVWDEVFRRAGGSVSAPFPRCLRTLTALQDRVILGAEVLGAAAGPRWLLRVCAGAFLVEVLVVWFGFLASLWGLLLLECPWELCESVTGVEGSRASPLRCLLLLLLPHLSPTPSLPSPILLSPISCLVSLSPLLTPPLLFSIRPGTP